MKPRSFLLITAVGGLLAGSGSLFSVSVAAPAATVPTTTASGSGSSLPRNRTASGNFHSSAGQTGTYAETFTVADGDSTDTVVYTLADSTETSTVTIQSVTNDDGTRTVTSTRLDFGATVPFTSVTTYAVKQNGGSYGTGTYTAADGTTGTLTSLVSKAGEADIISTDYTSAASAVTRVLEIENRGNGGDNARTLTVDTTGALTITSVTRFGGMHHHHF